VPRPAVPAPAAAGGDDHRETFGVEPICAVLPMNPTITWARRSSSAFAKYADASRRISFARRSSAFSRSSCLDRVRSWAVRPGLPAHVPLGLPHPMAERVSAAHPIFSAIEMIAAHCDAWS
jgi:hypothetical protein